MSKSEPVAMTVADRVDAYINLDQEIKRLEVQKDALGAGLKALGPSVLSGKRGSVEISEVAGRKSTDWKAVCIEAKVPEEVVTRWTKVGDPSMRMTTKLF